MPMYEYECTKCGHRFELIQLFSARPKTKCPECRGTLRKLLSASAIRFKGTGWYVTDYAKGSGAGEAGKSSEGSTGEVKSAGKTGEKGADKSGEKGAGRSREKDSGRSGEKGSGGSGGKGKSEESSSSKEKSVGKKDSA